MPCTLRLTLSLISAITLLRVTALTAEASCGSISDSDDRAFCRAKTSTSSSYCGSIRGKG